MHAKLHQTKESFLHQAVVRCLSTTLQLPWQVDKKGPEIKMLKLPTSDRGLLTFRCDAHWTWTSITSCQVPSHIFFWLAWCTFANREFSAADAKDVNYWVGAQNPFYYAKSLQLGLDKVQYLCCCCCFTSRWFQYHFSDDPILARWFMQVSSNRKKNVILQISLSAVRALTKKDAKMHFDFSLPAS